MTELKNWDWETREKLVANTNDWKERFPLIHEFVVSPDGEKISAVVKSEEGQFTPCVNGEVWENTFEKAWSLQFGPDGRLTCLVMNDDDANVPQHEGDDDPCLPSL